jgi:hypothetical protein
MKSMGATEKGPSETPRNAQETRMIVALLGSIRMLPEGTPDQPEAVERDDALGLISYGSLTPRRQAYHCRRSPRWCRFQNCLPLRFAAGLPTLKTIVATIRPRHGGRASGELDACATSTASLPIKPRSSRCSASQPLCRQPRTDAGPELLHAARLIEPVLQLGHLLAQRRKSVCE